MPGVPDVPGVASVPGMPGVPGVSGVPMLPAVSGVPCVPGVPGVALYELRTMRICELMNLAGSQLIDYGMRTLILFGHHFVLVMSYLAGSQFVIVG